MIIRADSLRLRNDFPRSTQSPTGRAIDTLTSNGLLIPVTSVDTFHGRAANPADSAPWEVDPSYRNGTLDSEHYNVNSNSTLYTSDRRTAQDFARNRAMRRGGGVTEVHEIAAFSQSASILDNRFNFDYYSDDAKRLFREALDQIMPASVTTYTPVRFDLRHQAHDFMELTTQLGQGTYSSATVEQIIEKKGFDPDLAYQLAGAINAKLVLPDWLPRLTKELLSAESDIIFQYIPTPDRKFQEFPINLEYLKALLHELNVIGVRQDLRSGTLGRDVISHSFFDLTGINTVEAIDLQRQHIAHFLGGIAFMMHDVKQQSQARHPVLMALDKPHASSQEMIKAAMNVPGYSEVFNANAGNWEGFRLREHTATVIDNFEYSYADNLPIELLQPMRLALLVHDLGKPAARATGGSECEYNVQYALDFLGKIYVDERVKGFVLSVIAEGAPLIHELDLMQGGPDVERKLDRLATRALRALSGRQEVSHFERLGYLSLCRIVQQSDGGAYTSIGITRNPTTGIHSRNNPSFNASFQHPNDPAKRMLRPRTADKQAAALDLTPRRR